MSSGPETKISLEAFHRHFIETHLKDKAPLVLDELEHQAKQSGELLGSLLAKRVASCYRQGAYQDDSWYKREIPLDSCYVGQDDFRLYPLCKGQRFVDFMHDRRQEIESDLFPCSPEIRAPWSEEPMPPPMVQERGPGKYYVLDGQLRVVRHWYHNIRNVKVFIYRGQRDV